MPVNLKALQRAFDLKTYLKGYDPDAKQYGPNIAVRCPQCQKDHKLWVLTEDKADGTKAGAYLCYYCADDIFGHGIIDLVKKIEDCNTFKAIEVMTLHQRGGKPLVDLRELVLTSLHGISEAESWDEKPIEPVPLPREFIPITSSTTLPRYFKTRGINHRRALRHGLGWCSGGYFDNRLVVPVTMDNQHLFFVARYMKPVPPSGTKKTVYPKGSRPNRVLFNYDRARHCERVYIVEDVFSAMHLGKAAMASFGTQFSQYQFELLLKTSAQEVVIIWDLDSKAKRQKDRGYIKSVELAHRLAEFWNVRAVKLPDDRDPDEMPRADLDALVEATPILNASAAFRARVASRL